MEYTIQNGQIQITVDDMGAELKSIVRLDGEEEYMWDGNPEYWSRTSPVLFPFIGGLHNGAYTHNETTYEMTKHGFLRDTKFVLTEQNKDALWFEVRATKETKIIYPFDFEIEIGYVLYNTSVTVVWKIYNRGSETMEYSIGGHPAFRCPFNGNGKRSDYAVGMPGIKELDQTIIGATGFVSPITKKRIVENEKIYFTDGIFDQDALVFADSGMKKIELLNEKGESYVTFSFDAPIIAVWSKPEADARFVCFEPWYGLCDVEGLHSILAERKWTNHLEPSHMDQKTYTITVH